MTGCELSMERVSENIQQRILRDMSEGVFLIGMNGVIQLANPKLCEILGMRERELTGRRFSEVFFLDEGTDAFCQVVLDAIANKDEIQQKTVPYTARDGARKHLSVTTSFLREGNRNVGVIGVLSDVTQQVRLQAELAERKRQIDELLDSLVETLATAVDERSHYTANHTANIVRYAERFLDYLEAAGDPWAFDADRRRSFLMSAWLHDVGKLLVPLEVMDKADRLGDRYGDIRRRFRLMALLDENAMLRGAISREAQTERSRERDAALALIERINGAGFLNDEDLQTVLALGQRTYTDENGEQCPWITEDERKCLCIQKGTLTDGEREVMQSHVVYTKKILDHVRFPERYRQVPVWASEHHEQVNGCGYPLHLKGDDIPREARLLTILDIFEALTASDRPYKKPMSVERSLNILHSMVDEGRIDGDILKKFENSRAWERTGERHRILFAGET